MKITIIVEGRTEKVFIPHLREYLRKHLPGKDMPKLDTFLYHGRVPKNEELKQVVENLLQDRYRSDHVIALTDVYTGTSPPDFTTAQDAKTKMRQWVGNEPRFHPHAAQHDFEAWLLPYWLTIQRLAGHNRKAPSGNPESVNHNKPPSTWIREIFEVGQCRKSYSKPRDAGRILRDHDLSVAVEQCAELKSLVNTILSVSGGTLIP